MEGNFLVGLKNYESKLRENFIFLTQDTLCQLTETVRGVINVKDIFKKKHKEINIEDDRRLKEMDSELIMHLTILPCNKVDISYRLRNKNKFNEILSMPKSLLIFEK